VSQCHACGQETPARARFCPECGGALTADPEIAHEERRVVSVIFVDLVGFTARAEQLDPEDVRAILTPYHAVVRREIESHGAVVEKFIGDAVVGVFGTPIAHGDDAERAVRAALVVIDSIGQMNADDPALDLHVRVAVNTGETLATLGADHIRGEAMVMGDVVNTASRLQHAAPVDGVLVGEETFRATREAIRYMPALPVTAKGKSEPLAVWVAKAALLPAGQRAVSDTKLVGRARELAALRRDWDLVTSRRALRSVTIIGAPGAGKTRLCIEFASVVESTGGTILQGRSLAYRESSAYGALAAQVKSLCEIFDTDSSDVAAEKLRLGVAECLPAADRDTVADHLGVLLGLRAHDAIVDRDALFDSVHRFIGAIAHDRPVALVFEDAHWAGSGLLDLVESLTTLIDCPILLLLIARPELLDTRPKWAEGPASHTAIPLGALSEAEAQKLAELRLSKLGARHAADAAKVAGIGEGNPLFIEQLAAMASEDPENNDWSIPLTIKGTVAARLDALPRAERSVLMHAAVVGKTFWRGALEQLSVGPLRVDEALSGLARRNLIRHEVASVLEGDEQYAFTHDLIRDGAYDHIPKAKRPERHRLVAAFLEQAAADTGETAGALASHWRAAGDRKRAIVHLLRAAEQAEQGWAKAHAANLYQEAAQLVDKDDTTTRASIRRRLAVAAHAVYHIPDAQWLGEAARKTT
jgi:class 3 adenylate cyclase